MDTVDELVANLVGMAVGEDGGLLCVHQLIGDLREVAMGVGEPAARGDLNRRTGVIDGDSENPCVVGESSLVVAISKDHAHLGLKEFLKNGLRPDVSQVKDQFCAVVSEHRNRHTGACDFAVAV